MFRRLVFSRERVPPTSRPGPPPTAWQRVDHVRDVPLGATWRWRFTGEGAMEFPDAARTLGGLDAWHVYTNASRTSDDCLLGDRSEPKRPGSGVIVQSRLTDNHIIVEYQLSWNIS